MISGVLLATNSKEYVTLTNDSRSMFVFLTGQNLNVILQIMMLGGISTSVNMT